MQSHLSSQVIRTSAVAHRCRLVGFRIRIPFHSSPHSPLRGGTDNDLAHINTGRLFDGERNGAGDCLRRHGCLVRSLFELGFHLRVGYRFREVRPRYARRDDRHAQCFFAVSGNTVLIERWMPPGPRCSKKPSLVTTLSSAAPSHTRVTTIPPVVTASTGRVACCAPWATSDSALLVVRLYTRRGYPALSRLVANVGPTYPIFDTLPGTDVI